ncbi:MAG: RDD family protein [Thermoanaerobaculia bacterium]|nr:RDD family protein [Thermoanaerobaculia bacterium]MCZ7652776.1 RDD family protein [Thermoanaerobaculia bacterium]
MSHPAPDEPGLFDLPLRPPAEAVVEPEPPAPRPARRQTRGAEPPESLPLFPAGEEDGLEIAEPAPSARPRTGPPPAAPREGPPRPARSAERPQLVPAPAASPVAPLGARAKAAAGDLLVLAAVLATQVLGAERLGAPVRVADWPAYAAFQLAFSYLYWVIPLAFWGQTPGMVWAGVVARNLDDGPLAFGQTARRWLGALLTLALLGLPGLGALRGRSLADWMSGSRTLPVEPVAAEAQPA